MKSDVGDGVSSWFLRICVLGYYNWFKFAYIPLKNIYKEYDCIRITNQFYWYEI